MAIFLGKDFGVDVFNNDVQTKTIDCEPDSGYVKGADHLCADSNGTVYASSRGQTGNRMVVISGSSILRYIDGYFGDSCCDSQNNVWSIQSGGVVCKIVNGIVVFTSQIIATTLNGICCDLNDNIWVSSSDGKIHKLVNGVKVLEVAVPGTPGDLICDRNNAIWVTNKAGTTVSKVVSGVLTATITVGSYPVALCCDPSNVVWVANSAANASGWYVVSKIVNDVNVLDVSVYYSGNGSITLKGICSDGGGAVYAAATYGTGDCHLIKIENDTITINTSVGGGAAYAICCDYKSGSALQMSGGM